MDRSELIRELDRIIDIGIVNAKHDSDVLKHVRKVLKEPEPKPAVIDNGKAFCPHCMSNIRLDMVSAYCAYCGRPVKWE